MVLLEREVKCECHKRWRPDHNLRVVRDTKHQKKAKEKTRSTGYTPWTSSSNYFDGGLNAGMIAMMSSSGAGCGGMVSSGGDCCGGDGGCC